MTIPHAGMGPSHRCAHFSVMAWSVILAASASAQNAPSTQQRDQALRRDWSEACNRVMEGDPWDEIAADLELALAKAGETPNVNVVADYLDSIRQAEAQWHSLPPGGPEATPEDLVALLMESRLLNPATQRHRALIVRPLHLDTRADGTRYVHWVDLGSQPEHEAIDPATRIFKRGRVMIPALLDTLDDMTATRSAYITSSSNRLTVLCRRCDLAMALLQAVTRCRFYVTPRNQWFSLVDAATRETAIQLARQWRQETKELSQLDARSWLIGRVTYVQAEPMIDALIFESETERAIEHLRAFLHDDSGRIQIQVARKLGSLGDRSALDAIVERGRREKSIKLEEIELLVGRGGRREYMLLRDMVADDEQAPHAFSRMILQAMKETHRRLAIPVFAAALDAEEKLSKRHPRSARADPTTRADLAAEHIQRLTHRDFRYDRQAEKSARIKAIARVRDWWEREGRGLYGFGAARARRTGGIR